MEVGDYVIYIDAPQLMKTGQFGDIQVEVDHRLSSLVFVIEASEKGQAILAGTGSMEGVKFIRKLDDNWEVVSPHFAELMKESKSLNQYFDQIEQR